MDESVEDLAAGLASAIRQVDREMRAHHLVLTPSALLALHLLDEHPGGIAQGELSALARVKPPTMTRVLKALETRKLITRDPDPEDLRRISLVITKEGKELLELSQPFAWLAAQVGDLPVEDRDVLFEAVVILDKISQGG
jgi:DNA-binding MarR family transcriptional regulator